MAAICESLLLIMVHNGSLTKLKFVYKYPFIRLCGCAAVWLLLSLLRRSPGVPLPSYIAMPRVLAAVGAGGGQSYPIARVAGCAAVRLCDCATVRLLLLLSLCSPRVVLPSPVAMPRAFSIGRVVGAGGSSSCSPVCPPVCNDVIEYYRVWSRILCATKSNQFIRS